MRVSPIVLCVKQTLECGLSVVMHSHFLRLSNDFLRFDAVFHTGNGGFWILCQQCFGIKGLLTDFQWRLLDFECTIIVDSIENCCLTEILRYFITFSICFRFHLALF